jgi:redox-sensitive bicupin YhaK (pirin superfamily)
VFTILKAQDRNRIPYSKQDVYSTFDIENRERPHSEGFNALDVFHEKRLLPGADVIWKSCKKCELITYISRGTLTQKDRAGNIQTLFAGEFQSFSAALLADYSEKNASKSEPLCLFRIALGLPESAPDNMCERKRLSRAERSGRLCIAASPDGRDGSLLVHSDVAIFTALLPVGRHLVYPFLQDRKVWLHIVKGEASLFDVPLVSGDGAGIWLEPAVSLTATEETEILMFDVKSDVELMEAATILGQNDGYAISF